ncbi:MAG: molecular chaperone DnaJ [Acidobacteriota bacterium]|nr:molecular chaperone DnaJ [Acidobacteriota bacterium]
MEGNASQHALGPGDLNDDLIISLEEAATGKTESLNVIRREMCEACAGTGESWRSDEGMCASCGNKGWVERHKELKVSIPAGIETGVRLRLSGGGEVDAASATLGDLYLTIKIREHELFERQGKHLYARATVTRDQMMSGTEVVVPTLLDGRKQLRVPPGTASGTLLRLAGLGLRSIESSERGDLFVKLETPTNDTTPHIGAQTSATASTASTKTGALYSPLNRAKAAIVTVIIMAAVATVVFVSLIKHHLESPNQTVNTQASPLITPSPRSVRTPQSTAPPDPARTPFSLPNGTDITPPQGPRGDNTLTIINGGNFDTAVKIVNSATQKTRRFVYVRANETAVIKRVAREVCILRVTSGTDWDSNAHKFLDNRSFYEFDKVFDFRKIRYTVSLTPEPSGTLRDFALREEDFEDK